MGDHLMLAQEALKAHRTFLQEVLAEVMPVLLTGVAGDDRLVAALEAYWDACLARRDTRRAVIAATRDTRFEAAVEPMGQPFLLMVRAELTPGHGAAAANLAKAVYDEARRISVDEAVAGGHLRDRRDVLIERIRARPTATA